MATDQDKETIDPEEDPHSFLSIIKTGRQTYFAMPFDEAVILLTELEKISRMTAVDRHLNQQLQEILDNIEGHRLTITLDKAADLSEPQEEKTNDD